MAKAKRLSTHDILFFDRLLMLTLVLTATAYIFRDDWIEPVLTIGALFTGVLWSYRTATNYPNRNIRVGGAIIFSLLAVVSIYYLAMVQGRL